jgi:hypothetical protein
VRRYIDWARALEIVALLASLIGLLAIVLR